MMNYCAYCINYRKDGYCVVKKKVVGYLMTHPCFESKPTIVESLTKSK